MDNSTETDLADRIRSDRQFLSWPTIAALAKLAVIFAAVLCVPYLIVIVVLWLLGLAPELRWWEPIQGILFICLFVSTISACAALSTFIDLQKSEKRAKSCKKRMAPSKYDAYFFIFLWAFIPSLLFAQDLRSGGIFLLAALVGTFTVMLWNSMFLLFQVLIVCCVVLGLGVIAFLYVYEHELLPAKADPYFWRLPLLVYGGLFHGLLWTTFFLASRRQSDKEEENT